MIGTTFKPKTAKAKGNEDLIPWLIRMLTPHLDIEIRELTINDARIIVILIPAAKSQPTSFMEKKYIRVDSYTKPLNEYPLLEQKLWKKLEQRTFETENAAENINPDNLNTYIDTDLFFQYLELDLPKSKEGILERLLDEKILTKDGKSYNITNLGAILFARNLDNFPHLSRKKLRIIHYATADRLHALKEWELNEGYAASIVKASEIINLESSVNEVIQDVIRKDIKMYPKVAVREFLANALIHQDFWIHGTGPTVEIFPKRMEITNPGKLLVAIDRLIDCAPQSRNEILARLMRRMHLCEERGSGIDRAITEIELYQLPAPEFRDGESFFRVIMYAHQNFREMNPSDKIRACYQHCCLCYVKNEYMTNSTLRERFGIPEKTYPVASRIIKATLEENLIKIQNLNEDGNSPRHRKYIPYWG